MLTAEQRNTRRAYIGSSDSPAILGLDPYRTAYDVWLDKTADIEDDETSEKAELGNRLEPVLIDLAEQQLGRKVQRCVPTFFDGPLCANLDARVDEHAIIEAKTSGLVDGWGDEGTDHVPDKVLIQTHHAMKVTGAVIAYVPVILARFGLTFKMFRVERNNELCDLIGERARAFHAEHVAPRVAPTESVPSLEVLRRLRREPASCVDIADDIVQRWLGAKEQLKAAKQAAEDREASLLAAMGPAESARCGLGLVTYFQYQRKGYDVAPSQYRALKGPKES